jgi:uncharacterized Rmd1/YagE family protein
VLSRCHSGVLTLHMDTITSGRTAVRVLQIGESLNIKGLERADAFSTNPFAYRTGSGGTVVLFKTGTIALFGINATEESAIIQGLGSRTTGLLDLRELETTDIVANASDDELAASTGALRVKTLDQNRLLLIAEALAVSVALAYDERRIMRAFERIEPVASRLIKRQLPRDTKADMLNQIGEALLIQHRLADRADLDEKPDVLWDHPELERFWTKLVDEYDLPARARAIERKLVAIRETADTITDLLATRTSHRLEWYVIGLITLEIVLGLYDRWFKLIGH